MAGVTRQAVSHWFRSSPNSEISIRTPHLKRISEGLRISAEDLLHPLPVLGDAQLTEQYEAALLWDRLYPGLGDFGVALVRGEWPALARLVQVYGLYQARKIAGPKVWDRFPDYKRHIRPVRREQLERVWQLHRNLTSV